MKNRIQDNASDQMNITINANNKVGWKHRTEKVENELNIEAQDYTKPKKAFKTHITERINQKFKDSIRGERQRQVKGKTLKTRPT